MYNETAPDAFCWWTTLDCERPNSPSATHLICLFGLENDLRIHDFRPTWPCKIVEVLATWAKFIQQSNYCTFSFVREIYLVASTVLWHCFNMTAYQLSRYYPPKWIPITAWAVSVVCVAFKLHTEWSHRQRVSTPPTTTNQSRYIQRLEL